MLNTLENIGKISIPRKVVNQDLNDPIDLIKLHGFSDASLQNFGASIYIRSISKAGNVSVNLIASKSRLSPIKQSTIPRLELLGNILLSRLMNFVRNALPKCNLISNCYFWTDSQVTLSCIKTEEKMSKPFVKNTVSEIQKNTDISKWFFCDTKSNPVIFWHAPKFMRIFRIIYFGRKVLHFYIKRWLFLKNLIFLILITKVFLRRLSQRLCLQKFTQPNLMLRV